MIDSPSLRGRFRFSSQAPDGSNDPIRSPIYNLERLEAYARSLATEHRLLPHPHQGRRLSQRLQENARALLAAYHVVIKAVQDGQTITPAAEWLANNFYIVDEQLRQIQEDLPAGFYRRLPKLEAGFLAGYPRVFALAWAFVAHTDSRFDPQLLERFIGAYQEVKPLKMGELWALPISLRVVLVENLRRLTELMLTARAQRLEADSFADDFLELTKEMVTKPTSKIISRLLATPPLNSSAAFAKIQRRFSKGVLPPTFIVQLAQRLREEPKAIEVMYWLEEHLTAQQTTLEEAIALEHQMQAAANVSVRNVITSMRLISAFDWAEFFERVSWVNGILIQNQVFAACDFATRDRYRHALEELADGSKYSELEVAHLTLEQVEEARVRRLKTRNVRDTLTVDRLEDPGYYLISKGRKSLEHLVGFRAPWQRRIFQVYIGAALPGYLGILIVFILVMGVVGLTAAQGSTLNAKILLVLLASIPISELAIALLNAYIVATLPPRRLPKLELKEGIPEHLSSIVVVPTLLGNVQGIRDELERLEVRYLANSEGYLQFALLTDFTDAQIKTMPGDELLWYTAFDGIRQLNQKHGAAPNGESRFLLFHRERSWNESERCWMGWERKRGKLHELNRLLRGAKNTNFVSHLTDEQNLTHPIADKHNRAQDGKTPLEVPKNIRFVITLDADTQLPRGAAAKLVGAMAHPLNRPLLHTNSKTQSQQVIAGYAVLQPRITLSLPLTHQGTLFQKVYSSHAGMDPYSSAASDVYQDLFNEGSYTGKGIYDLDAFEAAIKDRVPENTLLSHDLFEGVFARAGLISDVELVEEYPDHYQVHATRQHRWTRGDWQLLPWILSAREPIALLGRWKMLDNLRRSMLPMASLLALIAGWVLPGVSALTWTLFVIGTLTFPALLYLVTALVPPVPRISRRSYFLALSKAARLTAWQVSLTIILMADQASLMTNACLRTLFRLGVTRRNLLEWRTAAQSSADCSLELSEFYRRMSSGVGLALASSLLVMVLRPNALGVACPILLLWFTAPMVARYISLPRGKKPLESLSETDRLSLRLIARQTWRYFERFVTAEDNYLPPDNFQEIPKPVVAHRTSPTNIGLALISTVSAHDLGWLGLLEMTDKLEATLSTTFKLERFRGHLYNWYGTQDLRPLAPLYVSSVDSGNLAGHLITLAQACTELKSKSLLGPQVLQGIADAVALARKAAQQLSGSQGAGQLLESVLCDLEQNLQQLPLGPLEWAAKLEQLKIKAHTLVDTVTDRVMAEKVNPGAEELVFWSKATLNSVQSHQRDLQILLPWIQLKSVAQLELETLMTLPAPLEIPEQGEEILVAWANLGQRGNIWESDNSDYSLELRIPEFDAVEQSTQASQQIMARLESIVAQCETLVEAMDFGFLFDQTRKFFSIGYKVAEQQLDPSFYDLLASEARLTSFLAIAKGEVPTAHWFHLGRELTPLAQGTALVSWAGSMFEYLMPALVMRTPKGSLLAETQRLVVDRQISYGKARGVPWGISESAYAAQDFEFTYQYSSFGVPGLGLKRGLGDDLVIAPYASALAAMIEPLAALQNLARLEEMGGTGTYGFYDALDFTRSRLPQDQSFVVVQNVMVHHQGMALVALTNVLLDDRMVERFHADPRVQSAELLLQERIPRKALVVRPSGEKGAASL